MISNPEAAPKPDTSIDSPKRIGLFLLFLVFGVFGIWASIAPIDSSAHAPGFVTVESYKKVIQHLEGGIVKELLARNGDFVRAGEPLLILDDTQSLAQLEIANAQYATFAATEARLLAERNNLDEVVFPEFLRAAQLNAEAEMDAQNQIFQARKAAYDSSIEILQQRIQQLQSRLSGLRALQESKEELAASYAEELEDTQALLSQGFSDKIRLRELERNYSSNKGEAAELTANISATEIEIGETRQQIILQEKEKLNEVAELLGETQTKLKDIRERINALSYVVGRTTVRAPEDGLINGMQIHTVGGVIAPGNPIAEIVPQGGELVIEARISPNDIDRVAVGQDAMIRFSSFGRAEVPTIYGNVKSISADRFLDEYNGAPYYQARIEVSEQSIRELGSLSLLPGMPAEAFINTGSRTFMQYLMKPLTNSLARSFRED